VIEEVPLGAKGKPMPAVVLPLLQAYADSPIYHALVNVDFSKTENQLVNEFKAWLKLPDNQKRLAEWRKPRTDAPSNALARLKDLAAWRLFRELLNDWGPANDFANQHRKRRNPKEARAFRDAKPQGDNPANEAALFGEESDAFEAQRRAWKYLGKLMPDEFAPISDAMAEAFVKLDKLASQDQD
jgi:hypothetical protein